MVTQLIVGPTAHGVTRFALDVASVVDTPVVRVEDGVAADLVVEVRGADAVHVNVTDRLFGPNAPAAAERLVALAEAVPLTVTLHDLPQPSDGPGGFERRAAAYARIVEASRGVVVSSRHEHLLLATALREAGRPDLLDARAVREIPLPLDPPAPRPPAALTGPRDLVVLGFLYPGKGHEEALAALPDLPADVGLVALGRPSDGHDDLVESLAAQATSLGRRFAVTGYVPDAELLDVLQAAAVPVAPHQHLSASGSIGSWISAGRRPIVPHSRYVDELDHRCPGTLSCYDADDPDALARACAAALEDPGSTWLGPDAVVEPSLEEVGRRYAAVLAELHR